MYSKTTSLLLMLATLPGGVFASTTLPAKIEVPAGNITYLTS